MIKRYVFSVLTACVLFPIAAQDGLNTRSMTIEGMYNPQITDALKITPVPEKSSIRTSSGTVTYIKDVKEFNGDMRHHTSVLSPVDSTAEAGSFDGLIRLGYGLRNAFDGLYDFNWQITELDKLSVSGNMYGWRTDMNDVWRSDMAYGMLNADYSHVFDKLTLYVNGAFGLGKHNYMPGVALPVDSLGLVEFSQPELEGQLTARIVSTHKTPLKCDLFIGWYGLNRGRYNEGVGFSGRNSEDILRIEGFASIPHFDGLLGVKYRQKSAFYNWYDMSGGSFRNFTTLSLTPFWRWSDDELEFNIGFSLDVRNRVGSSLMAVPDVWFRYRLTNKLTVFADWTGGFRDNEVRTLNVLSPYWYGSSQIKDGYTFADLSAGLRYSVDSKAQAYLLGGYRYTKDELLQVQYDNRIRVSGLCQDNAGELYLKMGSDVSFSGRYNLDCSMTLSKWNAKHSDAVLLMKPWFDFNLNAKANVYGPLDASLRYRMSMFEKYNGYRVPMINNLSVCFDYDIQDDVSLFLDLRNLLGRKYFYYAGYRDLKFNFLLGATVRF